MVKYVLQNKKMLSELALLRKAKAKGLELDSGSGHTKRKFINKPFVKVTTNSGMVVFISPVKFSLSKATSALILTME